MAISDTITSMYENVGEVYDTITNVDVNNGNNLLKYPYVNTTSTVSGVTFTDNGNGSITINGTSTSSTYSLWFLYENAWNYAGLSFELEPGTYTFKALGTDKVSMPINIYFSDNTNEYFAIYNDDVTKTITEKVRLNMRLLVNGGVSVNNVTIYPQINKGNTALPYQPYTDTPTYKNIENIPKVIRNSYLEIMNNGTDKIWNNWEKVTGEGETLTLNSTEEAPMKIDLKGNTFQQTYTGANILDVEHSTTNSLSGMTSIIKGNNFINGTTSAIEWAGLQLVLTLEAGTYYYKHYTECSDTANSNGLGTFRVNKDNQGGTPIINQNVGVNVLNQINSATFTIPTDGTYVIVYRFGNATAKARNIIIKDIILSKTDVPYQPYVNNAPSPNPDYPQDIHVVSGDNVINVVGKNYCNGINQYVFLNIAVNQCGTNSGDSGLYIPVTSNTYTISTKITQARYRVACSKNIPTQVTQTVYRGVNKDGTSNSITIDTTGYDYLIVNATDLTAIQIEKGSSASEFQPYQSQSYPINLGDIELCKIGTYQDYIYKDNGSWYLHKEIGKVVLNGSENWVKHGSIASWFYYDGITNGYVLDNTQVLIKTNYYTPKAYQGVPNLVNGECSYGTSDSGITHRFVIKNTDYTQTNDFKNWLSTHNTIVYYALATPTNTEITDTTLISQLEAVKRSYNGQTNISQENNDKPFILDVTALKELAQ